MAINESFFFFLRLMIFIMSVSDYNSHVLEASSRSKLQRLCAFSVNNYAHKFQINHTTLRTMNSEKQFSQGLVSGWGGPRLHSERNDTSFIRSMLRPLVLNFGTKGGEQNAFLHGMLGN